MKISMGNFGNALPAQVQPRDVGQGNGQIIAQGLGQLANTVGDYAQNKQRQDEKAAVTEKLVELNEYEQQSRIDKIRAENDFSTAMLDIHNSTAQIKQDVLNGNKAQPDADAEIQKISEERWGQLEKTVPFQHIPEFKARYQGQINEQRAALVPAQIKANQNSEYTLIEQAMSINSRNPDRKTGAESFARVLQNSNIPDAKKSELAFAYRGQVDYSDVENRMMVAVEKGDVADLSALAADLSDNKRYMYLDAQKADAIKKTIGSRIGILNNRAALQVKKQEQVAETTFNKFFADTLVANAPIDDKEIERVQQIVQGTPYQKSVEDSLKNYKALQRFNDLPLSQQEAEFAQMDALWSKSTTADPTSRDKIRSAYLNAMQDKKKLAADNPVSYIAKQGIYQPEPINALAILTPDGGKQVAGIVADRVQALIAAQQKDPSIGLNPLQDTELQGVKQVFGQMNNEQKLQFFGQMIGELKHVPQGARAYGSFLGQVAGKDNLLRLAGIAEFASLKGDAGTRLSAAILDGQMVLQDKTTILPDDNQLQQLFNDYVGNAITGQSKSDAFEIFKAVHASYAKSRNVRYENSKDKPNKYLLDTALSMATGGIYTQNVRYSGVAGKAENEWKVVKPYGMSDDSFKLRMDAGLGALAKKYGTTVDELDNYRLRQRAGNERQYILVGDNGRDLILNGRPVMLDVGK